MVCIAAFIILALIGIFVAIISIFKPEIGKNYLKALKKAWGCLWKKVRLQKCETGFKDDVKNTLLKRVVVKHPTWVKPLSAVIEVLSVVIVVIAVWALLTAVKSLLALWALGSCNVTKPSQCSLGAEICSIDQEEPSNVFEATGRWFEEWGEIFEAIPEKFQNYDASSYNFNYVAVIGDSSEADRPIAVDIFDPGCIVCLNSYVNQKATGFFDRYEVRLVPFAIQNADGGYKFRNSGIIVRYMLAAEQIRSGLAVELLDHIFTERTDDEKYDGMSYQQMFNSVYDEAAATKKLEEWLADAGLDAAGVAKVREIAAYPEITTKMNENREIVENQLNIRAIPTMIYEGKKHAGLWSAN